MIAQELHIDLILDSLTGTFLILQPDAPRFTILTTNTEYARITGLSKDQMVGHSFFDVLSHDPENPGADALIRLRDSLANVVTSRRKDEVRPFRFRTYDSTQNRYEEKYWSAVNTPAFGEDGNIIYIVHCLSDQTESEKAAQKQTISRKAQASKHQSLHGYFQQAPAALAVITGPQLVVSFANDAMLQIWNRKPEEVLGRPWLEVIPAFRGQGFEELLYSLTLSGRSYVAREQYAEIKSDDKTEIRYFDFTYQPYFGKDEPAFIIFAKDVTEQVSIRRGILESEERLSLAVESAHMGIWDMDLVKNETIRSLQHDQIFGYESRVEHWGFMDFFDHVAEDDRERVESLIKDALESGTLRMDMRIKRADGNIRWVSVFGKVYYSEDREPLRMLGTITDITDRKRTEQSLIEAAEEMEERIFDRTYELQRAIIELKNSNNKLEEFVYAASHDLQEPLRKIVTFTGLITQREKENLSPAGQETLSRIVEATERLQMLIKDLFDLSQTTNSEEAFQDTNLQEILLRVLKEMKPSITLTGAEIDFDTLPMARVIPTQMHQLFENLLSNALKFSAHANPPKIKISSEFIRTGKHPMPGLIPYSTYLKIRITDNGIGFDQEYEDKIFQLFQRLHGKSAYPGTGVGLAICKKIAENHYGMITAKGKPGKGAVFTIFLKVESE